MKILLGIIILILIATMGPEIAGYHQGVKATDLLTGAHCIKWVGQVWCK